VCCCGLSVDDLAPSANGHVVAAEHNTGLQLPALLFDGLWPGVSRGFASIVRLPPVVASSQVFSALAFTAAAETKR
jgi:hypothetical protein